MTTCTTPPPSLNPVTYVLSSAKLSVMGHRWVAELADFNFNSKHRPGKFNDADVLSRLPLDPSEYMGACKAEMEKDAICTTIQAVIHQKENARHPEDQSCVSNFALFTSKIKKKIPSPLTNQRSAILSSMLL